jgi:propionyl-CoA carboxylase alpha chain
MRSPETVRFERRRVVMLGNEPREVLIEDAPDGMTSVVFDGVAWPVDSAWRPGEPVWTGTAGGERIAVQVRPILNGMTLSHAGVTVEARVYTPREAELAALMPQKTAAGLGKQLLCPMPGLVKAILVRAGQEVKTGEPLCIVEAMKMENMLRAERDATIARIAAKEGDSLAVDAVILEFA